MKVNKKPLLITFIAIMIAIISWMFLSFKVVSAAQVAAPQQRTALEVSGLDAGSAVIKDKNGNVVSGSDATTNNIYTVNYNWSVPDGVEISTGDTATFEIPNGVKVTSNMTNIPVYDVDGAVIGTFSIGANETTGTITFNDNFSNDKSDRKGMIQFAVNGAKNPNQFDWNISKAGWVYDYDENGMLKNIIWNITFNPNSENLTNVVITDTLGPNQEYVDSSVYAQTGNFIVGGIFVPDGGVLTPKVTVEGNKISFDFGNVNKAVNMSFRVKPAVNPNGNNVWTNDATLTSDQVQGSSNADVSWGGSGNGNSVNSSITLVKKDATTGALLADAGYNLLDAEGNVVREHLTTNSNGQINLYNIPKGDYTLVEVEAPEGYELNKEPIHFTVTGNETAPIELSQIDQPITGGVVLSKLDETTYEGLAGAEFNLLDESGNIVKENLYTDETGKLEVSGLQPGKYSFVEVKAPEGYELDSTPIEFTITKDQTEAIQLTKLDIPQPDSNESTGGFKLTKTDKSSKVGLPGAVYELRFENGNIVAKTLTTDKDGKIFFDGLTPGKYTLVEVKAPEGYELNSTPINFTVLPNDVTILTATNEKVTEPSEPEKPVKPNPPVKPGEPSEPSEPEKPVKPNPPVKPGEPSEPEKPVKPNPPVKPGEPSEPEKPVKPNPPVKPGEPSEPEKPVKPNPPVEPGEPSEPETPVFPTNPGSPNKPGQSLKPVVPELPDVTGNTSVNHGVSSYPSLSTFATNPYAANGYNGKTFPKTGDKQNLLVSIVGFTMLIGIAGFEINHKHS